MKRETRIAYGICPRRRKVVTVCVEAGTILWKGCSSGVLFYFSVQPFGGLALKLLLKINL